jgi:hypothetical protein
MFFLTHFIKGKIVLSLMEIILSIPRELEYLQKFLKLAWKKGDNSMKSSNLIKLEKMPTIHKICINKSH